MSRERGRWRRSTASSAQGAPSTRGWTAAPRSGSRSTGRRSAGGAGRSTTASSTSRGKAPRCIRPSERTGEYAPSRAWDIEGGNPGGGIRVAPAGLRGAGAGGGTPEDLPGEEDLRGYFGGEAKLLRGPHRLGRRESLEDPQPQASPVPVGLRRAPQGVPEGQPQGDGPRDAQTRAEDPSPVGRFPRSGCPGVRGEGGSAARGQGRQPDETPEEARGIPQ